MTLNLKQGEWLMEEAVEVELATAEVEGKKIENFKCWKSCGWEDWVISL